MEQRRGNRIDNIFDLCRGGRVPYWNPAPSPRRFQKGEAMAEKRITEWVQRFKDRPMLMLQWIDPETGKRKSRSAETADEEAAETARSDLEYELDHGTYQEPSRLDWERFRELFEAEYVAGLRPRTREKYTTVLDVFEQIINPSKLRAVTERTLSLFVKGMRERKRANGKVGLAPMTMKNYLIALKAALNWAVG